MPEPTTVEDQFPIGSRVMSRYTDSVVGTVRGVYRGGGGEGGYVVVLWDGARETVHRLPRHLTPLPTESVPVPVAPFKGRSPWFSLKSKRAEILTEATNLVTGDRNNQYGDPLQDFQRTAKIWAALGYQGPDGRELKPSDVAKMMAALKLSRLAWSNKRDSYVDLAGYASLGFECSEREQP